MKHTHKLPLILQPPPLLLLLLLLLLPLLLPVTEAAIEEVEITPSSTNGIELGELSYPQFLFACIIFIKLVTLYAVGVLPVEINLGEKFGFEYYDDYDYYDDFERLGTEVRNVPVEIQRRRGHDEKPRMLQHPLPGLALDCTLQYICEVDRWTLRSHASLPEKMLAYIFRNEKAVFTKREGVTYGGLGTCREMYPCPLDIQTVVGIKIPGSQQDI
ncbi:uncharacterized protein LOC123516027 [Portunus trituberculatus]|uniref:uncharacterized protein LOC123516027 n=1 Tax=Portunus trituberculatus TaxID=210409 RepID=UPI001E1CFBE1|nr:uncharacterized protein LOC123516027 [Portunus trituberculatus]